MGALQQRFLQSVTLNGMELPRPAIFKTIYVEKTELTAPVIVLYVHDTGGKVADDYKAVYGSTLVAEFGDPSGNAGNYKETFFVTSAPSSGDVSIITAATDDIVRLKTPSVKSWLYTDRQPMDIIKAHVGKTKAVCDIVDKPCSYHLNVGVKPSRMLSQIAHDRAALVWVAQGVTNFRKYDLLLKDPIVFEYEAYNPQAKYTISRLKYLNEDSPAVLSTKFYFTSWSPTQGYVHAGNPKDPIKHISDTDPETLQSMTRVMIPKLEIDVSGNAAIKAGIVLGITIHRMDANNQLSEALPQKMVVMRVAHVEERESYMTRIVLGVPN